jgi:hypothetical protein
MEQYCSKMPNLTSFVFADIPESFYCFTIMLQLKSFRWHCSNIEVNDWNQFASSVSSTLRDLYIVSKNFNRILSSSDSHALPFLTSFYLEALKEEDLQYNLKTIMPQLKHYYVILQTAKLTTDDVRITNYMPNYAAQMQLNTFTVHFFSDNLSLQRLTYYKGDISATQSCDYSFGF